MKFIKDMLSRKSKEPKVFHEDIAPVEEVPAFENVIGRVENALHGSTDFDTPAPRMVKKNTADRDANMAGASRGILEEARSIIAKDKAAPAVNIWDIEDENDTDTVDVPEAKSTRRRRNATRVLSFDNGASDVVPMFDSTPAAKPAERTKFPVGWILVSQGPGRGECFTLEPGMSQIGRGEDQAIQLDFGDSSISRSNHAAIVYDTETHSFMLGHGGKKNIVRLNGSPVISNETLKAGDKIKIGETELHFVPLCTEEFNWSDAGNTEEQDDVAIA